MIFYVINRAKNALSELLDKPLSVHYHTLVVHSIEELIVTAWRWTYCLTWQTWNKKLMLFACFFWCTFEFVRLYKYLFTQIISVQGLYSCYYYYLTLEILFLNYAYFDQYIKQIKWVTLHNHFLKTAFTFDYIYSIFSYFSDWTYLTLQKETGAEQNSQWNWYFPSSSLIG